MKTVKNHTGNGFSLVPRVAITTIPFWNFVIYQCDDCYRPSSVFFSSKSGYYNNNNLGFCDFPIRVNRINHHGKSKKTKLFENLE